MYPEVFKGTFIQYCQNNRIGRFKIVPIDILGDISKG
jgi:hypothetical protein